MLILYDIPSQHPDQLWSPNVWKIRLALNYKGLEYRTEWVEYPDIEPLAKNLGVRTTGFNADQVTPEYTLPIVQDLSTGVSIADSFPIARYLDETYPDTPRLFPKGTVALIAAWVEVWHKAFCAKGLTVLLPNVRMGPGSEEYFRRTKAEKLGKARFEDIAPQGAERTKHFEAWELDLGKIAGYCQLNNNGTETGYVMGDQISYADFVVAGWVGMAKLLLEPKEWEMVGSWHDGLWAKTLQVTDEYRTIPQSAT